MDVSPPVQAPVSTLTALEERFAAALDRSGMHAALAVLNSRTRYRFTGLYRVEPPVLRNIHLYDRENPALLLGGDVKRLDDTYCAVVAATRESFATADAGGDMRVQSRARRSGVVSYFGVPIRHASGRVYGTLCHFDTRPRLVPSDELSILESVSTSLARWLWDGESVSSWRVPAPRHSTER